MSDRSNEAPPPGSPGWLALRAVSTVGAFLPPGLGQAALLRRLLGNRRYPLGTLLTQQLAGGACFELDLGDRMQRDAFFLRRYDPDLVAFVSGRLRPSGVFLDVGAHVGLITFSVAARVPGIEVHAFEASGANAARWRRNHELNPGAAAVLVEAAVGAASGEVDFAAPPTGESGWGSISGPTDGRLSMRVPVVTLDDYAVDRGLEFVDVVKVDIEGYEPFAVQGASRLLSERRVGCLVLEVNEPVLRRVGSSGGALQRSLEELGYQAFPVPRTGARRFRREKPTNVAFVAG